MIALVTYPYRDRETLAVHLVGEEVELTEARFAELSALGHVDLPPAGSEAAADTAENAPAGSEAAADTAENAPAEDGGGEDSAPEQPAAEKPAPEMTVQQLRDAIEAANGFAPRKATKAELAAILAAL